MWDIVFLVTLISENLDCPCIGEVIFAVKPRFWTLLFIKHGKKTVVCKGFEAKMTSP
jgi:hypothetical protein